MMVVWFVIIVGNKEKKKKSASSSTTAATILEAKKISPTSVESTVNGQNIIASTTTTLKRQAVSPPTEMRRVSLNVPRSPTLPPEMRHSSFSTVDSPRKSSTLVARLMGLDDIPVISPASAAEKRRKLLGALEKCDEDLKTLKQIIDAVRLAETGKFLVQASGPSDPVKEIDEALSFKKNEASSLDSTTIDDIKRSPGSKRAAAVVKNSKNAALILQRERISAALIVGSKSQNSVDSGRRKKTRCSKVVEASVNELWKDGAAAEMKWELGKVGAEIAHRIFRDLVDELVKEVELCFSVKGSGGLGGSRQSSGLPFDACRRRLVFS